MPDFRITIHVRDVSGTDVDALAQDIREAHGEDFDAGDFTVLVAQRQGDAYFTRDEGDDVLEGGS